MPTYTYYCTECKKEWEAVHTINERNKEVCCNKDPDIIITKFSKSQMQYNNYYDVGLGEWITGPKHRKRIMKEKNLVEVGNEKLF